jgi:release factor glutamine methyltransferase
MDFLGLKVTTGADVYEPSDDTELLAQAVERLAFGSVLDLGCGTGAVGIIAAKRAEVKKVFCSDVNPGAVGLARINAKANGVENKIEFFVGDLFQPFKGKKNGKMFFDTIAFNPPYLPTKKREKLGGKINYAFDGGAGGRETTGKFLASAPEHLRPGGMILLVCSSLSGIGRTVSCLEKEGFAAKKFRAGAFSSRKSACFPRERIKLTAPNT